MNILDKRLCISMMLFLPIFGMADKPKDTKENLARIKLLVQVYMVDYGYYPIGNQIQELENILKPTYTKELVIKDAWDHPFQYASDGENCKIWSLGPDGVASKDDLADNPDPVVTYPVLSKQDNRGQAPIIAKE